MVKLAWFAPIALLGLFATSAIAKPRTISVATLITDLETLGTAFSSFSFAEMPTIVQDMKQLTSDVSAYVSILGHTKDKIGRSALGAHTSATHLATKVEKAQVSAEIYVALDRAAFSKNRNALGVTNIVSDITNLVNVLKTFKPTSANVATLVNDIVKLVSDMSPLINIASMLGMGVNLDYVEL